MLKNYLGYIPQQDGDTIVWQADQFLKNYPYSSVAPNVDRIREAVAVRADKWFNTFMKEVETLAAEKKFNQSLELLQSMPTDIISPEKQIMVKEKNQELLLAEAVENETEKMARIQELQHQWNNGLLLAKAGRYEESISVFTDLLDTEYSQKAEMKIREVSLEASKNARKMAADFFLRYNKTSDLESKKKLLIESRKLLRDILVKYPQVEIIPKVRANIKRVEQEMMLLDPMLLQMVEMQEQQAATDASDDGLSTPLQIPQGRIE
jgi:hypothetical protein